MRTYQLDVDLDEALRVLVERRGRDAAARLLLEKWQAVRGGKYDAVIKSSTQLRHAGGGRDAATGRPQGRDA